MHPTVAPLDEQTWPAFAALAEAHHGVWAGCWCMAFHADAPGSASVAEHRAKKEIRVREGNAHAALVFDGDECVGWCQFGPPAELPLIKRRKVYEKGLLEEPPPWRITCFFTANKRRRQGVGDAALAGALELIAAAGGGEVEAYPELVDGRKVSGSFLHGGTVGLFERHGFERGRQIGKHHFVMTRAL